MGSTHTITLMTRDGATLTFDCGEEQSVLEAAAKANIFLPSMCSQGHCGSCHGHARGGEYAHGFHTREALTPEAARQGELLTCRTYPRSDLAIEIFADQAHITMGPAPTRQCEITAMERLGGGVIALKLQILPDAGGDAGANFEPGQFMDLGIPGTDSHRAYSMANAPNWDGVLEFLIRLQPGGAFSTWLEKEAAVGGRLQAIGPKGTFMLQAGSLNPRRLVAGGTGLAPMLSMLRQMAEFQEANDAALYFGVNVEKDLFALDQIDAVAVSLPNLRVEKCVWKPEGAWDGFVGSPVAALERDLAEDVKQGLTPEVYLCGPPGLVDAATAVAERLGLPHEQIHYEKFLPS